MASKSSDRIEVEPVEFRDPSVLAPTSSPGSEGSFTKEDEVQEIVDPKLARRVKWKLDLFILPLLSSVYFFATMGKSDLGNAKIAGLSQEMNLSPGDYSNAATVFLAATIIFQLPGTLLIKKIHPNRQFSGAMIVWGVLTALTVLAKNSGQLLAIRFLVGAAESFVQGGVFYLSFWYQYSEYATRGAVLASMSTIAGAFNGLIAYAIVKDLDGANGWRAWRWIFLIEGIAPIAFAFVVLFFLPSSPQALRWGFTEEEKKHIMQRSARAHNTTEQKVRLNQIWRIMLDVHFWLFMLVSCASAFCQGSLSNFLPDIIAGFGYSDVNAQLFTVIVYVCGCVGIIFFSRIADLTNARGIVLASSTIGAVIGYAILIWVTNRNVRFAATCIVAFSIYPSTVLQLSWGAMSFVGYTRRGSMLAFFNIFPHLFAISGTQAYQDPPYYSKGNAAALGMSILMLLSSIGLRWYLGFMNNKKKANQFSEEAAIMREKSIEEVGDHHPDFFYTL
ncbi:putative pantothenate transporter [Annulohypoxylon maeteangense]|uniref:putative pantothenate transporter n=1 Tax=Annulohypoxylon maeteangense TaxID=1927788 RepID=UPI002007FAF1|nr:putative pantothenate transporter [Annulohypoxylon maeteangense]KAI0882301.1 putative pantothenate transporter [Annulohypoxylon maeteangense]